MRPPGAVTAVALALAAIMIQAGPAAQAGASSCLGALPQVQQVTTDGIRPLAGSTPVLFVHGILSSPRLAWGPTSPSSISGQAAAIPGATAWTFDYAHQAEDWVRKQAIGPDLAVAISCLAQVSGHKVVIIGHSMGGLAAQFALGQDHGQIAADTAELVTIGTPFDGSALLSAAQRVITDGEGRAVLSGDVANAVLFEALLSACAGIATHTDNNPCALLSVPRAPIGTALEEDSPQIRALPPWPPDLPVLDTAGDMRIDVGIGRFAFTKNFGDLPVSLASATAHDTAGPVVVQYCGASKTIIALVHGSLGPCYHSNLPKDPQIIAAVLAAIRANLLPAQPWTSGELTITPHSLGAVTIGMTIPQASAAAGVQLIQNGDGVYIPRGGTPQGLSVAAVAGTPVSCVAALSTPGAPRVITPQGFPLGGTLAQLKALYGSSLRFVPAPASGITPFPGYMVSFPTGNLAFLLQKGSVYLIIGGPGVLPSTECA